MSDAWEQIEAEAQEAVRAAGRFPFRAYSEFMPPPYVGVKPYAPSRASAACTSGASDDHALDITEYEQREDSEAGLSRTASLLVTEIARLARGTSRLLSHTLLEGNPAWPTALS